jgi:hypothetical protein
MVHNRNVIMKDVEVVVACLRNSLPTGRFKQNGTCIQYYFQSLLTTKGHDYFMHRFIIFVWVCDVFRETCGIYAAWRNATYSVHISDFKTGTFSYLII